MPAGPKFDSLDTVVASTYLASHTSRCHFGSLVSPVSLRAPALLGVPKTVVERLQEYEQAGAEEVIIQSFGGMRGSTEFDLLAKHILPYFNQRPRLRQ